MNLLDPTSLPSPWHISSGGQRFVMRFPTRPQELVLRLDAKQIDGLIGILCKARPQMVPPRERAAPGAGERVEAIVGFECVVATQPDGSVALQLNHPAFGWLTFLMDRSRADKIAFAMAEQPAPSGAVPQAQGH